MWYLRDWKEWKVCRVSAKGGGFCP